MLQMSQGCGKAKDKIKEYVLTKIHIHKQFSGEGHVQCLALGIVVP